VLVAPEERAPIRPLALGGEQLNPARRTGQLNDNRETFGVGE